MSASADFGFRVWGARGSLAAGGPGYERYGGPTSCFEMRGADGALLIVDAGCGLRVLGDEAEIRDRREFDIFLTHLHYDHIWGLPFFAPLHDPRNRIRLWSAQHDAATLEAALMRAFEPPYFAISLNQRPNLTFHACAANRPHDIGGLRVTPFALRHPGGCYGGVFETATGALALACDHEHGEAQADARLAAHIAGADILVYDAAYTPAEMAHKRGWGHSTWKEGCEAAIAAGAGELILTHHAPMRKDDALEDILAQARACFIRSRIARPLLTA